MDAWVQDKAANAHRQGSATVFVCVDDHGRVLGIFALDHIRITAAEVARNDTRGLPEVRTVLLCQFARHVDLIGQGVGPKLMAEVMRKAIEAADVLPAVLLALDARNDELVNWYQSFDFKPTRSNPMRLYMSMKRVRAAVTAVDAEAEDAA